MLSQVIAHLPYPPYSEESVRSQARALLAEYDRAIAAEARPRPRQNLERPTRDNSGIHTC